MMKVTVYSHFYTVTGYDYNGYQLVKEYAFRFAEYDYRALQRPPRWGQPKPKPKLKKIYAAFTENKREFRFHVHTLNDFEELLKQRKVVYDLEYAEIYKPSEIGLKLMPGYVARENQEPLIEYLAADGVTKVLNLQTGQGKSVIDSEKVLTPNGWVRNDSLKVGDLVRCPDNTDAKILGVYPQGTIPTLVFRFKGVSEPKVCSYDHLWEVSINGKTEVYKAFTICHYLNRFPDSKISVPRVDVSNDYQTSNERLVEIESIELGQEEPCTCISIDHPRKVYVISDGIVTHNTFCALAAAVKINGKIFISIETRFFNLWREALDGPKKILDVDLMTEVLFIQGSKELRALLQLALDDNLKEEKVFIVASRTLANFFEAYERSNGDLEGLYPVIPHRMYEVLDIATRIKDEVHLSLFANFKEELYMHTRKSISLSATLEDGSFLDKILAIMFPQEIRSPETEYLKYIEVYSLMYSLNDPTKVVTSHRGSTDYSHNAFEAYILSKTSTKMNYFKIIREWLKEAYVDVKIDKQRGCIFVSSVEMATALINHLREVFPKIHFERYAASSGDVYDEAKKADVLITTVQSFGTGFDLEDLICSLLTTSLRSQKTNLQVLGRLRVLKNYPDQTPKFYYLVCSDIPKHLQYHEVKKTQFYGKVKSHRVRFLPNTV